MEAAVGRFFQTDSPTIKDIMMRENATYRIIVAGLLLMNKDVHVLKQDVSPFAGCYHPELRAS
jgi:hypothetical protein